MSEIQNQSQEPKKKRGRPRKTPYSVSTKQKITEVTPENIKAAIKPATHNDLANVKQAPGEVAHLVAFHMEFANVERADFKETSSVREHIEYYLLKCAEYDMRPTVIGLANALGIDRMQLYRLYSGNYANGTVPYGASEEVVLLIQKTYNFIAENLESGMQNGKVNPVSAMFLLKNHLGYTDANEVVIRKSENSETEIDIDAIRQRYQ